MELSELQDFIVAGEELPFSCGILQQARSFPKSHVNYEDLM